MRWRTWLGLYVADKSSLSSESSLSSSRVLKERTWEITVPYGLNYNRLKYFHLLDVELI